MIGAAEALERLVEGNRRFVAERRAEGAADGHRRRELALGQEPFAVIVGCSDSRVPAELVFDQGLGDLFVIRVAGHVVAPSGVASVEFAVEKCGSRLVVVLGHTQCGAVQSTIADLRLPAEQRSVNLRSIVDRIRPAVEPLLTAGGLAEDELWAAAVRANIRAATTQLRHGSALLERWTREEGVAVVGAEYDLASGRVSFLDGVGN